MRYTPRVRRLHADPFGETTHGQLRLLIAHLSIRHSLFSHKSKAHLLHGDLVLGAPICVSLLVNTVHKYKQTRPGNKDVH